MVTPVNGFYQCVPVGVPVHCEISGMNDVWRVVQGVDEKVDRLQREVREVIELLRQTKKAPDEEKKTAQDEDEENQEVQDKKDESQDEEETQEDAQDKIEEETPEEETQKEHEEAPVKKETLDVEEEMTKLRQTFEKKLNEMHERMCSLEKENAKLVSRTKEIVEDLVKNEETIELLQARVVDLENLKATNPSSTAFDDLVDVVEVPAPELKKVIPRTTSPNGSDAGSQVVQILPPVRDRTSEPVTKLSPTVLKPQLPASRTSPKLNFWEMPHPDTLYVRIIPPKTSFKPTQDWSPVPFGVNMEADNAIRFCIVWNQKNKENPKGRCLFYHGAKGCNLGQSCEFDHLDKSVICASLCKHFFDSNKTCRYGSTCVHAHAEDRPNDVPSPPRIEGCNTKWGWNGSLCLVAQKSIRRS